MKISQGGGIKIINKSGVIKYNSEQKWIPMQMTVRDCEVMRCGQGMDGGGQSDDTEVVWTQVAAQH